MAIALTPVREGNLWAGSTWTIEDENALAELLARVAVGQARGAEPILEEDGLVYVGYPKGSYEGARGLLKVGPSGDPSHRDGWMFQVISWIAAHRADRLALIRSPHMRHADKGVDGLMVEFNDTKIARVVISEEKGTGNARTMVRDRVWPEAGGKAAAIAYTLIETAKLNAADLHAYLADTLARIPDYKITKVDDLLPWKWCG